MKILVRNYISSGFTATDTEKNKPYIRKAVDSGEVFDVNFEGVEYFTALFLGSTLTIFVDELGE